jgi:beta-fructofuranosidase
VIGSGIADRGGTALLYRSEDLVHWTYLHPLVIGDKDVHEPFWTGHGWECPDFFALGDRYALFVSVWDGRAHFPAYFIGRYTDHRLEIETQGVLDAGEHFYAPQKLIDKRGRRIMFGWLREGRSEELQVAAGWSGVMSLPRILSLRSDGDLGITPVPELAVLRQAPRQIGEQDVSPGAPKRLDGIEGDCLELHATFVAGDATAFGVTVRCSPDGEERTSISYDPVGGQLTIDGTRSSGNPRARGDVRSARLTLTDEPLTLRVFLDRSVLEVFANDRVCITDRLYPERADSVGVELFSVGGSAKLRHLTAWELAATT